MSETLTIRRRHPGRTRAIGVGVAIVAHVALLAGLVLSVTIPRLASAPSIHVTLVPAFRLQPKPAPKKPPPPPERAIAPRPVKIVGPEPVQPLAIPAAPLDAAARGRLLAAPFAAPHEPLRGALRTGGGCTEADWLKLSPAERDACRQRAHDLGAGAPTYAVGPSDPSKRAYLDKQAAKNEKEQRVRDGPPERTMTGCFGNAGRVGCALPNLMTGPP